jgi:hypothetical protein
MHDPATPSTSPQCSASYVAPATSSTSVRLQMDLAQSRNDARVAPVNMLKLGRVHGQDVGHAVRHGLGSLRRERPAVGVSAQPDRRKRSTGQVLSVLDPTMNTYEMQGEHQRHSFLKRRWRQRLTHAAAHSAPRHSRIAGASLQPFDGSSPVAQVAQPMVTLWVRRDRGGLRRTRCRNVFSAPY